jgi:ribonucleoside-diphosphate reductase alpha chain
MFINAQGRQLTTIECLDLMTKIASVVVVGGVRRSSEISLSDLDDVSIREAKVGQFWLTHPHRALSNNSAVYEEKPTWKVFQEEWDSLALSGTGERGIFNRGSLEKNKPLRRKSAIWGGNPCLEICLRPYSFCNLSEVVARSYDTFDTLKNKVRLATIIGTVQSMVTDFSYLRPIWKENADEERLLGVSVTGQMDCPAWRDSAENMRALRQVAIDTNLEYAQRFGINQAAAITCTKPSGTASSVVDSAPGIHTRYSRFYIRRMRVSATDPILRVFQHYNVPMNPEVGQEDGSANTYVVEFPVKSPEGSITRRDLTAIEQIEFWLRVKRNWAEHTISCTVYVENGAWDAVGAFVYANFDDITGLSFLPKDDFVYQLAPYEEISEERYNELVASFPKISYGLLRRYEKLGYNEATREYSCVGDKCDIV